jgi:hypothetical protein
MPREDKPQQNSDNHIAMIKDSYSSQHRATDSHKLESQADREHNHVEEGRKPEQEQYSRISLEQEYEHQQEQEQQADRAYDDGWSSIGGSISDRTENSYIQQAGGGNNSTWEQEENQDPANSSACDNSDAHWSTLSQPPAAATAFPPLQSMQYPWSWPSQSRHLQQHTFFLPQNQGGSFMQYDQSISYIAAQTNAGRAHSPQINLTGNETTSEIHLSQSIHWNDPQAPMHTGLRLDHAPEFYSSQSHQQDGMSPTHDLRNGRRLSGDQNLGASSMDIQYFQHEPTYNTSTRHRATQSLEENYMDKVYAEYDHDEESDDDSSYDRPPKIARRS